MGKVNCLRVWTFCCRVLGSQQCTCQHLTLPAGLASLPRSITKQVLIWSKLNQFSTALPAPFSYLGMLFIYGSRHPTDVFKWFSRAYLDVSRRDNYIFLNLLKGAVSQDSWLFLLQKSNPPRLKWFGKSFRFAAWCTGGSLTPCGMPFAKVFEIFCFLDSAVWCTAESDFAVR